MDQKSHYQHGDTLFSEAGRQCGCGWGCFWARGQGPTRFDLAYCERCGAFVPPVKPEVRAEHCAAFHPGPTCPVEREIQS